MTDPTALSSDELERGSKAMDKERPKPAAASEPEEETEDEMETADAEEDVVEEPQDSCDTECRTDQDCCEGYYCGIHPERSQRKNYCLEGG